MGIESKFSNLWLYEHALLVFEILSKEFHFAQNMAGPAIGFSRYKLKEITYSET